MLSNFFVALSAVVPLFCLIFIGVLVKRYQLLTDIELNHVNRMVFRVFFSVMMFFNLYTADFDNAIHPELIIFGAVGVFAIFAISMLWYVILNRKISDVEPWFRLFSAVTLF